MIGTLHFRQVARALACFIELKNRFRLQTQFLKPAGVSRQFQILIVVRNHRFHASPAIAAFQELRQAGSNNFEHDVDANRGSRRSTQQRGDGVIGLGNYLRPVMNDARFTVGFLNGLDADASINESPICRLGCGVKNMKNLHAIAHALSSLLHQIFDETEIVDRDLDERRYIVRLDGKKEIRPASLFVEELGGPRGKGPKEKCLPAVQNAGI